LTLLEVLVVLIVIAVAAGIALPRLRDVGGAPVELAARRLADATILLRERAILGGTPATLEIDAVRGRWTAGDMESAALPAGVRFAGVAGVVRLDLDPAGDGPGARFELVDDGGHAATVVVPAGGGRARVIP
jgi:type II secretory pathway pseudopilin PulG